MIKKFSYKAKKQPREQSVLLMHTEGSVLESAVPNYDREYSELAKAVRAERAEREKERKERKAEERDKEDEALANAILVTDSLASAAREAGVSYSKALSRKRTDSVRERLQTARNEIEDKITIRRLDVLNLFMEAIDMARTMSDPANMINGADKVARMMGYYEPEQVKVDVSLNYEGAMRKLRELSDNELFELAQGRVIEGECA